VYAIWVNRSPQLLSTTNESTPQGRPICIDDIFVHSANQCQHAQHLHQVFARLSGANLTLRGSKCLIALSQVSYLGHVFSAAGMSPDPSQQLDSSQYS